MKVKMNYIDLFSGIGGFALGAYWAGMKFKKHYFSEIDPYCIELYKKRFPDAIELGDITKINWKNLPKDNYIVTGGFPCQDISIAGKGEGIHGKRSNLWFTMSDTIRILRPRFTIIENVAAITRRGLDVVLGSLAEIRYDAEWQNIRASDVGAPHRRERVWIVAYPNGTGRSRMSELKTDRCSEHVFWNKAKVLQREDKEMADTAELGCNERANEQGKECKEVGGREPAKCSETLADTNSTGREIHGGIWQQGTESRGIKESSNECSPRSRPGEWLPEPCMGVLVDGLPAGMDRFEGRLSHKSYRKTEQVKAIGNAVISQIPELLFIRMKEILEKEL